MDLEELKQSLNDLSKEFEKLPEEVVKQLTQPPPAQRLAELAKRIADQSSDLLAKQLREQMFWIYTVIVGFSLRQVMVDVLPRVLPFGFVDPTQAVAQGDDWWLEFLRLVVFLMMITRFFLGSVVFFKNAETAYKRDVFVGYLHFLVFFAWSLTLKSPFVWSGLSAFLFVLAIILLFDYLYWGSESWTPKSYIRVWAARNLSTLICSFVPALIFVHYCHASQIQTEILPLLFVLGVTTLDFYEMLETPPKSPMFPKSLLKYFP
jgi:hypothetical protein